MSSTVNEAFFLFNRDFVNLDPERTKIARASRDWLLKQLVGLQDKFTDFPKLYEGMHINFGSFARHTKIRELDDIDLLLTFSGEGTTYSTILFGKEYTLKTPDSAQKLKTRCNDDGTLNSIKMVNMLVSALSEVEDTSSFATTEAAEIVAGMPEQPAIKHGMARAYYSPSQDLVGMPEPKRFDTEDAYHATLFHELVHATGHEKRLKRQSITERNGFGSDPYCKEELIAELGSAFLCGHAGIVERTIDNSAAYLEGWLTQLKEDKTLIVYAAAQAQKAADFILGKTQESEAAA